MLSKKTIQVGTLFILTLTAAFLLFSDKPQTKPTSQGTPIVAQTPMSKKTPSFCKENGTIEYSYYIKIPDDQKRNNKFGLYVYAEVSDFFEIAQKLVNSNGGDWGYVLIPFNVKDRDDGKWGRVFKQLNDKHLIPIIQLWAVDPDNYKDATENAAEFLDEFVWPIRQRYISVYNEPNDAKFWNGKVDPQGYAQVLNYTIKTFKKQNADYFLLNGAFNVSAPNSGDYMDSLTFMQQMNEEVPGIFDKLDGFASHSYPQPNFSGSPYASGRWSIRAYETELAFLKQLGVQKYLPVFITETGWAHAEGENYNANYISANKVGESWQTAFKEFWLKDDRVMAVTPFTIRYDAPFDHFSWVNKDNVPYKQYEVVKSMLKVAGTPEKLETAKVAQVGCLD